MASPTATKRSTTSKAKQRSKAVAAAAGKGKGKPAKGKAPAKAPAKAANGNGPSKRELAAARDLELAPKIKEMRDGGASWGDIKAKLGVDQSKGQVLLKMASIRPKDRIKAGSDDELAAIVVQKRDVEGMSWADIAVRAGVTMGKVKSLYASTGKDPAESRVRKADDAAPAKPAAKKAAKPKATAGKAKGGAPGKRRKKAEDPSNPA